MNPIGPNPLNPKPLQPRPVAAPQISAPQTGTGFSIEDPRSPAPPNPHTGPLPAASFERISGFIREAAAGHPGDRDAIFRQVVQREVECALGPELPPQAIQRAAQVLADSPEMTRIFDRLLQAASPRRA